MELIGHLDCRWMREETTVSKTEKFYSCTVEKFVVYNIFSFDSVCEGNENSIRKNLYLILSKKNNNQN